MGLTTKELNNLIKVCDYQNFRKKTIQLGITNNDTFYYPDLRYTKKNNKGKNKKIKSFVNLKHKIDRDCNDLKISANERQNEMKYLEHFNKKQNRIFEYKIDIKKIKKLCIVLIIILLFLLTSK